MSERVKNILHFLLAIAVASGFVWWTEKHLAIPVPEKIIERVTDTLVVRDTVVAYKPVPYNVYVVDTIWYEVPIYAGRDTVFVPLPREVKEYRDSSYRAVISGFRPSLDTMEVYPKTMIITTTERIIEPSPRLGWGIQAGVGVGSGGLTPYVGVGVQYRIGNLQKRKN